MLKIAIVWVVDFSAQQPWRVIALALSLAVVSGVYATRHFAIKTDINELISPDLPWSRRVNQFLDAFPQREILAVVDGPTPELVEQAANKLEQALRANPELFPAVRQPQSGSFFERNGLLYLSGDEVKRVADGLTRSDGLLETLAADPSLRGSDLPRLLTCRGDSAASFPAREARADRPCACAVSSAACSRANSAIRARAASLGRDADQIGAGDG
jgi:hypothetical protein